MHCFNHRDKAAIGTCKHCSKGLCPDCAADLGHGLACVNSHETEVERINALISQNSRLQRMSPKTLYLVPGFTAFMGLVFLGTGIFVSRGPHTFSIVLGVGFLIYATILLATNLKAFKAGQPKV